MPSDADQYVEVRGETIVEAFWDTVARRSQAPALRRRRNGRWEVLTWADYGRQVQEILGGLDELGIGAGERVAILSGNRVEWHVADFATLANGSVTVPVYQTSSPAQVVYIVGHAGARVCFVENREQLGKVLQVVDELPKLERVVVFDADAADADADGQLVMGFEELRGIGRARLERHPELAPSRAAQLTPEQLATLVYTSGTTGPPKGAMISHANIIWTLRNTIPPFDLHVGERFLSFLPLSHVAERMISDFLPVVIGGETWFARSLATVAEDLKACRPTVFFAVPRVWEKLHDGVEERLSEQSTASRRLIDVYRWLGRRNIESDHDSRALDRVLTGAYELFDRIVGAKIRSELGLDKAHVLVTAAAPIHPDLIRWFHTTGLPLLELYGQTEDCGPTSANRPAHNKIGTVGPAVPGATIRIADDGEILVKGGNVCMGYFADADASAELIDDEGWMHSGDLGHLDHDGFLHLTGRKKDLIVNAAGKNIAPQPIEVDLEHHPLIAHGVVIGDRRRYVTALVTLDSDALAAFADAHHKLADGEALAHDPDVLAEVQAAIDDVNTKRSRAESIRKFRVLAHDFTIAGGELTPSLKVKRQVVNEKFADVIDGMYAEAEAS